MSKYTEIPQLLDEPDRIILFTPDEFAVLALIIFGSIPLGQLFWGILGAFVSLYFYIKFKAGFSLRRLLMRAYWFVPVRVMGLSRSPESVLRHWAG
jgi:conjugal transfer pilus assembly protein TraL